MSWAYFIIPATFVILSLATVFKWPTEKVLPFSVIFIFPLLHWAWDYAADHAAKRIKILKSRFNITLLLLKKLKTSEIQRAELQSQIENLTQEMNGLNQLWTDQIQNQSTPQRKITHYKLTDEQKSLKVDSVLRAMRLQKVEVLESEEGSLQEQSGIPKSATMSFSKPTKGTEIDFAE